LLPNLIFPVLTDPSVKLLILFILIELFEMSKVPLTITFDD